MKTRRSHGDTKSSLAYLYTEIFLCIYAGVVFMDDTLWDKKPRLTPLRQANVLACHINYAYNYVSCYFVNSFSILEHSLYPFTDIYRGCFVGTCMGSSVFGRKIDPLSMNSPW